MDENNEFYSPWKKISTSILSSNTNAALTLFALDENIIFDGIRFNAAHNSLGSMCGIYQGARSSLFSSSGATYILKLSEIRSQFIFSGARGMSISIYLSGDGA